MRRGTLRLVLAGMVALATSGCAVFLLGAGAAGGYAVSKDSISNRFELPRSHVYRVSREVLSDLGLVTVEDERRGLLEAVVEGTNVTITVKTVSEKAVELKVKARDNLFFPRITIAQTVYNRIAGSL